MRPIPCMALLAVLGACDGGDSAPATVAVPDAAAPAPARPAAPVPPPLPPPLPPVIAPPSMPPPGEIAQLRQEVAGLRREVAELRMIIARAPAAPQPVGALAPLPAGDAAGLAPAETMFRSEQLDQAWSGQAAAAVRVALARASAGLDAQVRRLECRTRTCRVELNPASADQLDSVMPAILANLGASLPNVTATQVGSDDASEATVLYLTR
jgi:hypothetical protein